MALENLTPATRLESILNGDDIAPVTREEYFLQKAASGSGGSSLPPYTSADLGKVLTVGEAEPQTVVVVPEQTVTIETDEDAVPLVGADASGFVAGNTGVMTVNGVDYNATAYDAGEGIIYESSDIMFAITYFDGVVAAMAANPGTYTVSLATSVPSAEPKWEEIIPPPTAEDDGKSLSVSVSKEIVTVLPEQTVTLSSGKAEVTGVTATRENHTDSCTLMIGAVPINLPVWTDSLEGYGFTNTADGYHLIFVTPSKKWMLFANKGDGSYVVAAYAEQITGISTVWERIIPDYALASEGDVLTIENGVPVWKATSPK